MARCYNTKYWEMAAESVQILAAHDSMHPSIRLSDRPPLRNRLGGLRRATVMAFPAIRAHDLLILVGHLVQEGGKRLTTVLT